MKHRLSSILTIVALAAAGVAQAATIIVPDDNPSLRDAVRSAGPGDLVQVRSGAYTEPIRVDRGQTGLTVETLGGGVQIVISGTDDAVLVKGVDGVTVRGFTLQPSIRGVRLDGANGTTLENLTVHTGYGDGIRIRGGSNNSVIDTQVDNSRGACVRIEKSPGALVQGGNAVGCRRQGYLVKASDGATIENTASTSNKGGGIRVDKSANLTLDANLANGNGASGIRVQSCSNLTITNNTANGCIQFGIRVHASPPIASVTDLTNAGNAGGGGKAGLVVN